MFWLVVLVLAGKVTSNWLIPYADEVLSLLQMTDTSINTTETHSKHDAHKWKLASSFPFITGNGFRAAAVLPSPNENVLGNICDEHNLCHMNFQHKIRQQQQRKEQQSSHTCIFIKSDFFNMFVHNILPSIMHVSNATNSVTLVVHNGDQSSPDGQSDVDLRMNSYVTTDVLLRYHQQKRLHSVHAGNSWWVDFHHADLIKQLRPSYLHCLPIGIENRQYACGQNLAGYIEAIRRNLARYQVSNNSKKNREKWPTIEELSKRPLLLVAFHAEPIKPDRRKVINHLHSQDKRREEKWYNETSLSHPQWLRAINEHRFVLAPFGHGLDTHRLTEIFLMGGIPVIRKSTISSCYDDSDNNFDSNNEEDGKTKTRGSLPMVLLSSWDELNSTRLELEWRRLSEEYFQPQRWDYKRLFLQQWLERLNC